jgi:RNA polymerase sigma-70 factor (ECF subfamily)
MDPLPKKRGGDTSFGKSRRDFPSTTGGMIEQLHDSSCEVRHNGLETLCRRYWRPVYQYFRVGWAKSNEDAKDLTQAFFLWVIEDETLSRFAPERASFRTYLKSLLRHFMQDREKAMHRLKRGGGARILELEAFSPSLGHALADPKAPDPEAVFEQAWKRALIAQAVDRVRSRFLSSGRGLQFRVFEQYNLLSPRERPTYAALGNQMGLKETDVHNYLFAVREEIRSELRAALAKMTVGKDELEREWNALFGA